MSCLDPKDLWTVETGHATPFCQPFLVSWWLQPDYLTSKLQAGGKSPFKSEGQARRGSINVPLPFLSSLCPPLGSSTADVMEGGGKPVFWLDCFSLPASMEFLLFSTSVNRGEHMGLGDSMFHGLLGCQNVLHYYLLQHSRWSSLRKKKPVRQVPRCPCWEQMLEQEHCQASRIFHFPPFVQTKQCDAAHTQRLLLPSRTYWGGLGRWKVEIGKLADL